MAPGRGGMDQASRRDGRERSPHSLEAASVGRPFYFRACLKERFSLGLTERRMPLVSKGVETFFGKKWNRSAISRAPSSGLGLKMSSLQDHVATLSKLIDELQELQRLRGQVRRVTLLARKRRQISGRRKSRSDRKPTLAAAAAAPLGAG
jgi:hypothetical protein